MNTPQQLARHFREVYFGGNWTAVALKPTLDSVSWEDSIKKISDLNTIATLVYHIHYYVQAINRVLEGKELNSKDELSFDHPKIGSSQDWEHFLSQNWKEGEQFISNLEKLADSKMDQVFVEKKYGTYFRNIVGMIEHTHYHLGQIAIIKKLI